MRHLVGRQFPDSARLESRGSCLLPCTSSITAYFQETHPFTRHTYTHAQIGKGVRIQSLPCLTVTICRNAFVRPFAAVTSNLPIIVHQAGGGRSHRRSDRFPVCEVPQVDYGNGRYTVTPADNTRGENVVLVLRLSIITAQKREVTLAEDTA